MTTNQILVAGRLRDSAGKISFTPAVPIADLMTALASKLPCDKIFFVTELPDGTYAFQEAGTLSLDIVPVNEQKTEVVLPRRPSVVLSPANEPIQPPNAIPDSYIPSKDAVSTPKQRIAQLRKEKAKQSDSHLKTGSTRSGEISVIKGANVPEKLDLFANAKRQMQSIKAA